MSKVGKLTEEVTNMLIERQINPQLVWVDTMHLTEAEKNTLLSDYELPLETLDYVTDIYEQSNYIVDKDTDIQLMILHIPSKLSGQNKYLTRPISFLVKGHYVFTFYEGEPFVETDGLDKLLEDGEIITPLDFLLEGMNYYLTGFFPVLREVTKERHKLDDLLTQRLTNKDLVQLASLQQTLTFFLSATETNLEALLSLEQSKFGKNFSEDERERLSDVIIEAQQLSHMADLEVKIVNKISQIFDSIMNNNLNDTMRFLTVWSLALAIPTLITGFFGMNINLPAVDHKYGWIYLIILSVILIVWMFVALKRRRKM